MNLKLVKPSLEYKALICEMLEEWFSLEDDITPIAIKRVDYSDFDNYCKVLNSSNPGKGLVPDTTLFCLDLDRNKMVGAVNIRHYLNERLLLNGGHIGDGITPKERNKGYGTKMISLALIECKKLEIDKVLMVCDKDNVASRKTIVNNGGILENEIVVDGMVEQRFWIEI